MKWNEMEVEQSEMIHIKKKARKQYLFESTLQNEMEQSELEQHETKQNGMKNFF